MRLPRSEAAHRWKGRTLVDRNGEAVGSIALIYRDKATDQPEWALLEASATRPGPTFVPLVNASEEGDTVRVPSDRTVIERAPAVSADRELSEEQEAELYRHYGIPYSRAESPSGLPASEPLQAGEPQPAGMPAPESLPAGGGAAGALPRETALSEPAPLRASDVSLAAERVGASPSEAPIVGDAAVVGRRLGITDPRVAAAAGAGLAVAAAAWRREAIGRQISTAISRLGAIPRTVSRQRSRRRRAKAMNQALTSATERTTALAREMVQVLAGAAVVSVVAAVQGGQRTWAGVQAAQATIRQNARRLQPRPRRRRRRGTFGMARGAAAISRLGAIPRTVSRQRRRRRRAKAVNQALTSATQQSTALAKGMVRALAGVALLPVATAARGGRRTWTGVKASQAAIRQRGRRLRPAPRRRRRRGGFGIVLGGAAGYVLGARAGEQRYQEITQTAKRLTERPELKRVGERAVAKLDQLSGQAAGRLQKQRQSIRGEASSSGDQPITAVPDTPPEPRPQPPVMPPDPPPAPRKPSA